MTSGKPRAVDNMHLFVPCQIDVVNKQLASPQTSFPNLFHLLSKASLGESYIYTDNLKKCRYYGKTPFGC